MRPRAATYDVGVSTLPAIGATSRGVRTLTTAGLAAVVAFLVLGILGMHGLGPPGATTHTVRPIAAASLDPHANHPAPDHTPVTTDAAGTGVGGLPATPVDDESAREMVMVCAAMLLAAAVGALVALRLVRFAYRAPLSLIPAMRVPAFPVTSRAGTGPPAVWEFSVVRC